MSKSIQERVRAELARQEKARKASEANSPESRSIRSRLAAQARKDRRIDDLIYGRVEPRTVAEWRIVSRAEYDNMDDLS